MGRERTSERYVYGGMALAVVGIAAALMFGFPDKPVLAQSQQSSAVFLPDGKLRLPTGFRNWVFVGGPLTPNGLNGGKANFPEFHNVYVEARNVDAYKRTGRFPEGTLIVKELTLFSSRPFPTAPEPNPLGGASSMGRLTASMPP